MVRSEIAQRALCSVVLAALAAPSTSWAGGFYVPQKDAAGIGLATAGDSARASDASTVYFNPAGMTRLEGPVFGVGVQVLTPVVHIRNEGSTAVTPGTGGVEMPYAGSDGRAGKPTPGTNMYYAQPLTKDLWAGIAITSPFGLALDYGREWFGRYDSIKSMLLTSNIAPSAAYRVNEFLSIGGGVNFEYAHAKVTNAVPNTLAAGAPDPSTDGLAVLKGDSWDTGFNVGVLLTPSPDLRIGAHYRSAITHSLKGSLTVGHMQGPLTVVDGRTNTTADLKLPAVASLAVAYDVRNDLTLLAEAQWFGWNKYDEVRVRFDNGTPDLVKPQGFRNSYSLAAGAQYQLTREWKLRGGVRVEKTPTVDEFRNSSIPDSDLRWIGAGASYQHSKALGFDFGLLYARFKSAPINLPLSFFGGAPAAGATNVRGSTSNSSVTTVAGSAYWNF